MDCKSPVKNLPQLTRAFLMCSTNRLPWYLHLHIESYYFLKVYLWPCSTQLCQLNSPKFKISFCFERMGLGISDFYFVLVRFEDFQNQILKKDTVVA